MRSYGGMAGARMIEGYVPRLGDSDESVVLVVEGDVANVGVSGYRRGNSHDGC